MKFRNSGTYCRRDVPGRTAAADSLRNRGLRHLAPPPRAGIAPGITGLWQVHGRSKTTFDEMVRLDLQYSRMWSPMLDVKILLQTPRAVFSGDGAY